jgi:hypothetical protein
MNKPLLIALGSIVGLVGCETRPAPELSSVKLEVTARRVPSFEADVMPILERYCVDCHGAGTSSGGIDLDGDLQAMDRSIWGRVADALRSKSMPPKGRDRPEDNESETLNEWISAKIFSCTVADQEPGRVTLRRLSRVEYDRTIRDLFGFDRDLNLAAGFPADDVGEGFDRVGDVLAIPPILIEKYLDAADRAIDESSLSPLVWSRIMNPPADMVPVVLRKPVFAVRSEPIKRIGKPEPVVPAVQDPETVLLKHAHEILRAFADRAFRRPATQAELTRLVGLVEAARKEGDDFDQAIRFGLKAVLISPHFLFLVEDGSGSDHGNRPQTIDDFGLASRLSYFLTSGPPDDELYQLAVRGELGKGQNLATEALRLLRGNKSRALVDGFIVQWLQIGALREVTPDPSRFPGFDEPLRRAMIEETCRFASAIIQEDRSVIDFLDGDFTFVNERLAKHYGIENVVGSEFRRVSLAGSSRGGILSQASVLTVTSNPTRTSPVKRGKWVLDTILGLPPLPPPEGVEGLKSVDGQAPQGTIRQQMERHRLDPKCATCHDRMDPLGFGLENFDAIGAWRTLDDGQAIDASGTLPGGQDFEGPEELRQALKSRSDSFVRCLTEKMLTYAIGRGLRSSDRCFVDEIVRKTRRDGDRFSSLVLAIVASPPFQSRSGVKPE